MTDHFFQTWINTREQNLAARDNIPVCCFDWGTEALEGVPGFELRAGWSELDSFRKANESWLKTDSAFFAYQRPADFQLHGSTLRFSSAAKSPYSENDTVHADYFECKKAHRGALLVLPHWNSPPAKYVQFCRYLNWLGFSALLVTLPYHGNRKPRECAGAEYAVSPNIGRTIASARQGIIDTLSCLDWLAQQGYEQTGIVGSSLGFGHAFLASALDPRLTLNVFNHCCSTVSDALWGMPRYRAALEPHITQRELRECWSVINPISYVDRFARLPKHSLLVLGRYDTIFARNYVDEVIRPFDVSGVNYRIVELACGHRTIADPPYLLLTAYHIGAFLKKHLRNCALGFHPV